MEFFKQTNIDFMGLRRFCAVFSIVLFLGSMAALWINGLTLGLDFTGGTQLQVSFPQVVEASSIRTALEGVGIATPQVVSYGTSQKDDHSVLIRIGLREGGSQAELSKKILMALPNAKISSVEYIGPEVGKELATNGLLALVVALLLTTIYIAIRFEMRFAVSSAVALIHDPILILGIFCYFHIDFDLTALVAVLTVLGYSLNDTIVVFDRVRENFRKMRKSTSAEIVNISVNQTLSRTIMTSVLTLIAVLSLFIYGGPKVHGFSLAMLIGIIIGTYSSVYVAGSLAVALGLDRKDFIAKEKKVVDDRP